MEHLVESHLGGFYISNNDPEFITETCEECGDSDTILLSWEEGHGKEALKEFFSELKRNNEIIKRDYKKGISKQEIVQMIHYSYEDDRNLISGLFEYNIITEGDLRRLNKLNRRAEKKQLELVRESLKSQRPVRLVKTNNR